MMQKNNATQGSGSEDVLVLNKRQLSYVSSGIIAMLFFVFVAGYFWGKRDTVAHVVQQASYDSFADQAYGASLLHTTGACVEDGQDEVGSESGSECTDSLVGGTDCGREIVPRSVVSYYGQLAGFGTKAAAHAMVERLAHKGVAVKLVARESRSPRGKVVTWYQVVTKRYPDKAALQVVVRQVERIEKIKGAAIVAVRDEKSND